MFFEQEILLNPMFESDTTVQISLSGNVISGEEQDRT